MAHHVISLIKQCNLSTAQTDVHLTKSLGFGRELLNTAVHEFMSMLVAVHTSPGWFLIPVMPRFRPSLLSSLLPQAKTFPNSVRKKVQSLPQYTESMTAPLGTSTCRRESDITHQISEYNAELYNWSRRH